MPASKSQTESVHPGQVILSHTNIVKCDDGLIVSKIYDIIFLSSIYDSF